MLMLQTTAKSNLALLQMIRSLLPEGRGWNAVCVLWLGPLMMQKDIFPHLPVKMSLIERWLFLTIF